MGCAPRPAPPGSAARQAAATGCLPDAAGLDLRLAAPGSWGWGWGTPMSSGDTVPPRHGVAFAGLAITTRPGPRPGPARTGLDEGYKDVSVLRTHWPGRAAPRPPATRPGPAQHLPDDLKACRANCDAIAPSDPSRRA